MSTNKWTLEARAVELPLAERFTIATESWDSAHNVFVSLTYGGVTGIGEANPAARWDETVEGVLEELHGVEPGRLSGPFDLEGVLDLLPAGSARCALDLALHDLAGKTAGVSVAALLGVQGRPLPPTSVTVPIAGRDEMVARARKLADHPVLKMKLGFDGDVEAVAAVRDVFDGALRVDANEGWTEVADAAKRLQALEAFDIELCEQPLPAGRHDELGAVTESTAIPVFADEDVSTAEDVAMLAGRVDGVNLKLRKAGGIRETVRAIASARSLGMGVMLGCNLESGVAATAGAHVAALVDHADLDGPLLLAHDPYPGVAFDRGSMTLPGGPGLGVREAHA